MSDFKNDDSFFDEPNTADDGGTFVPAAKVAEVASALKIANPGNLKVPPSDRRKVPRRPIKGHAMAMFNSGAGVGQIARVALSDASWTGIGIVSPVPVEPGTTCSLVPEDVMWPRQICIVVRCEQTEQGYIVGLRSKLGRAAA